jgi:fibronectin type 3 domain-containing protein
MSLSLSGCEQILGKETTGDFWGYDLIVNEPGREASPDISKVGKGIVLTWTTPPGLTSQMIWRRAVDTDYWPIVAILKDPLEEGVLPEKTFEYTDYLTDAGREYIYYINGGSIHEESVWFESRKTKPVMGLAEDKDVMEETEIEVSYNPTTGILTFTPALPAILPFPALGEAKALLTFDTGRENATAAQRLTFPPETAEVNLAELIFNKDFHPNDPLTINYDPVYQKQSDGVYIITFAQSGVYFTAGQNVQVTTDGAYDYIENVLIPERNVEKPGVPDVQITWVSSSTIRLAWDAVETASQYKIYRNGTYLITTNDLSYLDMGLSPSTEYTYQVSAVNKGGEGQKSPELSRTTDSDTKDLFEGLPRENLLSRGDVHYYQITAEAGYTYDVFWQDADTDQNYTANIQAGAKISKDSPTYLVFLTNLGNMISVSPGSNGPIFIEVQGFNTVASGRYTIRYTKRPREQQIALPNAPVGLQVSSTANTISLTWNPVTGASYYKVYRDDVYQNQTDGPSYTDTGLNPSTTYTYQVSAVNSRGEGAKAAKLSVTTQAQSSSGESNPIPLSTTVTTNSLKGGEKHYYTLSVESGMEYSIHWLDSDTTTGYGDIQVGVKTPGFSSYNIVGLTDEGNTHTRNVIVVSSHTTGPVIIGVENYTSTGGVYSIWYSSQTQASGPAALRVTASTSNSITLAWDTVPGAMSYKVYRSDTFYGTYTEVVGSPTSTTYTHTGLSPNTTYYYKVSAMNSAGVESAQSSYVSATTSSDIPVPSAPTGVTATASSTSITVSWYSVSGATSYKVYRSDTYYGIYTLVGSVPTGTTYTDTGLSPNTTYYYKVTALNSAGGESDPSIFDYATTSSSAPTGVTARASSTSITVSWYSVSGAMSYKVYRSDTFYGTYTEVVGSPTSSTTYTDTGLSPNTTYYYKVSAVNSEGVESEQSSYDSATTSSSGYAGSSSSNAITLSSSGSTWTTGTLSSSSPEVWYSFYISSSTLIYMLSGWDRYGDSTYTSDVSFEIYDFELNLIKTIDAGNGSIYSNYTGTNGIDYQRGTWTPGTWYVKVVPYDESTSNYGTYAIYFY